MSEVLMTYTELYELYDQVLEHSHNYIKAIDDLADRLRERDEEVSRLTKLCIDNNINAEIE